jgi:hypothetical protein
MKKGRNGSEKGGNVTQKDERQKMTGKWQVG